MEDNYFCSTLWVQMMTFYRSAMSQHVMSSTLFIFDKLLAQLNFRVAELLKTLIHTYISIM